MTGHPSFRVLVDACLTPTIVGHLDQAFGPAIDVRHADQVLPPATSDAALLAWASAEGRLIVTANRTDFLRLVLGTPTHPGLGLVTDQNTRLRQVKSIEALVSAILTYVAEGGTSAGHVFTMRRTGLLVARRFP